MSALPSEGPRNVVRSAIAAASLPGSCSRRRQPCSNCRPSPHGPFHNFKKLEKSKQWAERKQAAAAQIALAWLMAQKPWIVPIPGTTQRSHMIHNVGASLVVLGPDELKELNASVSSIQIQRKRLPDGILALSGVEAPAKK